MQPVRCYVKEVLVSPSPAAGGKKTKKSLVLSLRSSLVNRGLALKHLSQGLPLSGCISSIEDHVYVLSGMKCTFHFYSSISYITLSNRIMVCFSDFLSVCLFVIAGVSGCTFFLPFAASDGDKSEKDKGQDKDKDKASTSLVVGQPVECLVQEVNMTARSATLRTHRTAVVKAMVNSTILPFNALTPGQQSKYDYYYLLP